MNEEKPLLLAASIHLIRKEFEKAISIFDKVLEINPFSGEAFLGKGTALLEVNQILEAKECFEQAAYLNHPQANAALAESRKRLGESGSEAWYKSAKDYLNNKQFNEALTSAEIRLQTFPEEELTWFIKGNALFGLGRNDDAVNAYKRVIELNPAFSGALNNLGWLLVLNREFDDALIYFDKAIKQNPDFADAWLNKGAVLMEIGFFQEALVSLEKAKQLCHPKADPAIKICKLMIERA